MDKIYVQHKSGDGPKYAVTDDWTCWKEVGGGNVLRLPKDEYVLCDPPVRWVDVTKDVKIVHRGQGKDRNPFSDSGEFVTHERKDLAKLLCGGEYRLRQVEALIENLAGLQAEVRTVFLIEKKEPQ